MLEKFFEKARRKEAANNVPVCCIGNTILVNVAEGSPQKMGVEQPLPLIDCSYLCGKIIVTV